MIRSLLHAQVGAQVMLLANIDSGRMREDPELEGRRDIPVAVWLIGVVLQHPAACLLIS
jgi:hypothetical protein